VTSGKPGGRKLTPTFADQRRSNSKSNSHPIHHHKRTTCRRRRTISVFVSFFFFTQLNVFKFAALRFPYKHRACITSFSDLGLGCGLSSGRIEGGLRMGLSGSGQIAELLFPEN
jgi:hypothetical protein